MPSDTQLKLHLGCGSVRPQGWVNIDASWNARLAQTRGLRTVARFARILPKEQFEVSWSSGVTIHDVRKNFSYSNDSVEVVYASHLLEHLYQSDAIQLLSEVKRVLIPDGIVRFVVPDLRAIALGYFGQGPFVENKDPWNEEEAADEFCSRLFFGPASPPRGSLIHRLYSAAKDFHSHKWMYDAKSLIRHMRNAGFVDVQEKQYLESSISDIADVERAKKVLNGEGVCVEGRKAAQ